MSDSPNAGSVFESDKELEDLLRRFESCAISPSEFKHRQHLTVALIYVVRDSERGAHARMRGSLRRLLEHHGIGAQVYHETLTAFWLRRVRAFADGADLSRPLHELANGLCEQCGDSRLVFDYYSKAVIDSDEGRAGRVEPDLKAFDF